MFRSYHGSNLSAIKEIQAGKINWHTGGGELGKGFYTTPDQWVAFKASWNNNNREAHVVEIVVKNTNIIKLNQNVFNLFYAQIERELIKKSSSQRTYVYPFFDMIESPIVGATKYNKNLQHKWQSDRSADLLNSTLVSRKIISNGS